MDFAADQMCFACGEENPIGLKLTFAREGDDYVTTFVANPAHQGYAGIVHGGIIATVLDEVMARFVWDTAGPAATATLEVHYRRPAPVGRPILARGRVTAVRRGGRLYEMAATATLEDGTLLAEATAVVILVERR